MDLSKTGKRVKMVKRSRGRVQKKKSVRVLVRRDFQSTQKRIGCSNSVRQAAFRQQADAPPWYNATAPSPPLPPYPAPPTPPLPLSTPPLSSPPPPPPPPPPCPPPLPLSPTPCMPPLPKKRGRKKKRLDEVAAIPFGPTIGRSGQKIDGKVPLLNSAQQSTKRIPERRIAELILDMLQKRDTHEIFAQPVDPKEVVGYYTMIQNPMDLGTMRAKLQEGMYTGLDQLEKDVFLMTGNAMLFNSCVTNYFRQARAIHELAKRIFHTLKTDPEKILLEISQTRKREKKSQGEIRGSHVKHGQKKIAYFGSDGENASDEFFSGSGGGGNENSESGRHQIYKFPSSATTENESIISTIYGSSNQLVPGNWDIGYEECMLHHVKDLGQTAQNEAEEKLGDLTQTPRHSVQDSSYLTSFQANQHTSASMDGILGGATADANNSFVSHGAISKNKNSLTIERIDLGSNAQRGTIQGAACKGKSVLIYDRMKPQGGACRRSSISGRLDFQNFLLEEALRRKDKGILIGDRMDLHTGASGGKKAVSQRQDFQRFLHEGTRYGGGTTGICGALPGERVHDDDRKGIDRAQNKDIDAGIRVRPSLRIINLSDKKDIAQAVGGYATRQSDYTKGMLGLDYLMFGEDHLHGCDNAKLTDPSFKYMDLLLGDSDSEDTQNGQSQLDSFLFNAGVADVNNPPPVMTGSCSKYMSMDNKMIAGSGQLCDQVQQPSEFFGSDSGSGLLDCVRRPRSCVYPSTIVNALGPGQDSTMLHHGLDKDSKSLLNPYYGASSRQVQGIHDFLPMQPHLNLLNDLNDPLGEVYRNHQPQLGPSSSVAPFIQMQSTEVYPQQSNETSYLVGQDAFFAQKGLNLMPSPSHVQLQQYNPNLLNDPLGQNAFGHPTPQLPVASSYMPSEVNNPPVHKVFMQVKPQDDDNVLGQSLLLQQEPQAQLLNDNNAQIWNFQQQSSLGGIRDPDLALRLRTRNQVSLKK
ncbi:uncharacterized protein LOC127796409 isoform X2 [Diospyros lotus]|uniref:uncharacterized protein LOC127796409 isoform X2 n=1 Tax=Diospyros lotus TaxID=55363 RepID=UPI002256B51F|nr:uncharacterized protein LOC127796409 isoform X2 [Diospyros lotus]